jgi:hypothetical protein
VRKRYCRICKNLTDDTNRLLSFNRLIAEASLSLEELADSISHYVIRVRRKVVDKSTGKSSFKWVRPKSGKQRVTYSAVEVGLHRDQCLRGFVAPGIELVNVAKPQETAVERADRLYAANERVHHLLVETIMSKGKTSDQAVELLLRFNENLMKINNFRAKVMAETLPPQGQVANPNSSSPTINAQIGVMLPSTFGRSPEEVQRMIDKGMQTPQALPPAQTTPVVSAAPSVVDLSKKDVH